MKQGSANSRVGETKQEPISRAVDPGKVDQMGQAMGRVTSSNLYTGRGYEAPKGGMTVHHCGSQGKHR